MRENLLIHFEKYLQKLFQKYNKEKDPDKKLSLHKDYKKLRNELTKIKRDSKNTYNKNYFYNNKHKSSEIWKGIRIIVNIKTKKASNTKLLINNNLISDPSKIGNIFNYHFSTIGSKIEQKIPWAPGNYTDYFNKKDSNGKACINPDNLSFFLAPTVPAEIEKLIDGFDIKKSTGPNSIPVFILKLFKAFFSYFLSKLVNLCFEAGEFPDLLKIAKVTPLHKKESALDYLNPISHRGGSFDPPCVFQSTAVEVCNVSVFGFVTFSYMSI